MAQVWTFEDGTALMANMLLWGFFVGFTMWLSGFGLSGALTVIKQFIK